MKKKAVVFDLDGTLVHSLPEYRYNVVGATLDELGREGRREDIDAFWFECDRNFIIRERFGLEPEDFWKVYRKHDDVDLRRESTFLYDDIGFLDELKERGFLMGIFSQAPKHIADLEIGMIGNGYFGSIIVGGVYSDVKPKPNPFGLELCLEQIGVSKEESVYVGNAREDVETARNAGVMDVLVDRVEYDFGEVDCSYKVGGLFEIRGLVGI